MKLNHLTLAAVFFTLIGSAQIKPVEGTTPTPSRIKVYTPSSSFSSKSMESKDNSYRWTAKTDFVAMLTGEFPIIGEYKFANKFSVEGSAGVTYAFFSNDGLFGGTDNYEYGLFDDGGQAAIGSAFRGTLKFYPSSDYDAIEGWSFGIQLFTKTTNRTYEAYAINGASSMQKYTDSKMKNGISLIVSNQAFADSNVSLEYFFGAGIANIDREMPVYGDNSQIVMLKTSEIQPNFQFGTRIGFGY